MNALSVSATLIGGKVTTKISDANFTLITPAGYVLSIWGIICLLLGNGKNGDSLKSLAKVLDKNETEDTFSSLDWDTYLLIYVSLLAETVSLF